MNAVDLIVEDPAWDALANRTRLAQAAVFAAITELDGGKSGVVALLLTDDDSIAELNRRYRDKTGPTNVLSFPAGTHADNHLGDIALAWGVVASEAAAKGCSLEHHMQHLIIHGFFHLQGYDHQSDEEAEIMESMERRALSSLNVADPYADGTSGDDPHGKGRSGQ
jgi:probable rRNA maturation factor